MSDFNKSGFLFLVFLATVVALQLFSQSKTNLQKEKEKNSIEQIQHSIDQTNQLLSGSKEEKNQLLKKLDVLQSQISYRKELQETLSNELIHTKSEIELLKKQNSTSVEQKNKLEQEYALILKNKLIHRLTYNPMLTLLDPAQMDEHIKHWYLLERIEKERQNTLANLQRIKSNYKQSLEQLTAESSKQDSLLKSTKAEEASLLSDITNSKALIQSLNTKESGLNADLIAYKKKKDAMNKLIEESVKSLPKSKDQNKINAVKKINYPLKDATIISRFGKNMDGKNSKLLIRNNGIDLQSSNPFVSVSTKSEVVEIRKMPNQSYLLITKTGNLFLVYSNLENVLLRSGEKIEQGVNLGKAVKNDEGYYELHFETWLEKTALDPMQFLK